MATAADIKKRLQALVFNLLHDKMDTLKVNWDAAINSDPAPQKAPADVLPFTVINSEGTSCVGR